MRILLCIAAVAVCTGCASPKPEPVVLDRSPVVLPTSPDKHTVITTEKNRPVTWITAPYLITDFAGERKIVTLRGMAVAGKLERLEVYLSHTRRESSLYASAWSHGRKLPFTAVLSGQNSKGVFEDVSAEITRSTLKDAASNGLTLEFMGSRDSAEVTITPAYAAEFSAALKSWEAGRDL